MLIAFEIASCWAPGWLQVAVEPVHGPIPGPLPNCLRLFRGDEYTISISTSPDPSESPLDTGLGRWLNLGFLVLR